MDVPPNTPTVDADPFCAEFFADPFPVHARIRAAGAAVWLPRYAVWAVARHEHVTAVLRDWQTFSSAAGVGLSDFRKEKPWRVPSLLLETDPPAHDKPHRVLSRVLSPAAMRRLRERFAADADAMVDDLLDRETFDGVTDLAEAYPLQVFPDAVGMPRENRRHLLPYGNMVFNVFGPRNSFFEDAVRDVAPVLAWVQAQTQRDALAPGGFGAEIHAAVDTGELTAEEAPIVVRSLLTAGVDTTVNGLGAALHCLAANPDQFARLRAEPALARAAFDEAVRLETPVQTFFRTTTRPCTIGDVALGEGEKVLMLLAAANRDPRKWDRPDAFDVTRNTAGHVGYGGGTHLCVGMALARLEGECVLSALARKAASLELTGPPQRRYNNTLRGFASLPMRAGRKALEDTAA